MNLSGSFVHSLQMNSYGVRPLRVFRRRAKLGSVANFCARTAWVMMAGIPGRTE